METGVITTNSHGNCGLCRKIVRMREESSLLLCTSNLEIVRIDEEACEHYEGYCGLIEPLPPRAQERHLPNDFNPATPCNSGPLF